MRLGPFITANTEAILAAWERFAATILPESFKGSLELRDHAADILRATVRDMATRQTRAEQAAKAQGRERDSASSDLLDGASAVHGVGRLTSGFDLAQLISEYRALRASVLSLWRQSAPEPDPSDADDVDRFHESIDQSLAQAVNSYAERVNESRDLFLGMLGHDLRAPLNAIMLTAEMIRDPAGLSAADAADAADRVMRSGRVMSRMIGDLLDYTRTRLGGGMPVSPGAVDLRDVCREVVDEYRFAHPGLTLLFSASGDTAGTWDAARLRQVVSNLMGNAVQHGDHAAPITLTLTGDAAAGVTLAVWNRGRPIPPRVLPRVFAPLVRAVEDDARGGGPTGSAGLGLYIVHQLVLAHGGTVDVTSTAEAGTTFTVRLPARVPAAVLAR